jgi:hypothetical protein
MTADKTTPRKGLKGQNLAQQSIFKQTVKKDPYFKTPAQRKQKPSEWLWNNEY